MQRSWAESAAHFIDKTQGISEYILVVLMHLNQTYKKYDMRMTRLTENVDCKMFVLIIKFIPLNAS